MSITSSSQPAPDATLMTTQEQQQALGILHAWLSYCTPKDGDGYPHVAATLSFLEGFGYDGPWQRS